MKQVYMFAASVMLAMTSAAQTNAYFTFGRSANANTGGEGFLVGQNFDIYTPEKSITDNGVTLSFAKVGDDNNTTTSNTGAFRWFNGTQMTITPAAGQTITKVVMTCANASNFQYVVAPQNISNTGSFSIDTTTDSANPTITWTGNSAKPLVWEPQAYDQALADAEKPQKNQIRIKNMVVTYEGSAAPANEVANIAEFLEKADAAKAITITGEITLVYKTGNFTLWQDESASMITRGGSFPSGSIKNGSRFKGVAAKYLKVKNLPGGDAPTIPAEFTAGDPVTPQLMTPAEFQTAPYSAYVEIKNVHVNPTIFDATKAYIDLYSDAECTEENKITLNDSFSLFNNALGDKFKVGYTFSVIGFVGANGSGIRQFWPIEVSESGTTTGIDGIEANNDATAEYFNLQGIRIDNPQKGEIYIMRQGKTTVKVIK